MSDPNLESPPYVFTVNNGNSVRIFHVTHFTNTSHSSTNALRPTNHSSDYNSILDMSTEPPELASPSNESDDNNNSVHHPPPQSHTFVKSCECPRDIPDAIENLNSHPSFVLLSTDNLSTHLINPPNPPVSPMSTTHSDNSEEYFADDEGEEDEDEYDYSDDDEDTNKFEKEESGSDEEDEVELWFRRATVEEEEELRLERESERQEANIDTDDWDKCLEERIIEYIQEEIEEEEEHQYRDKMIENQDRLSEEGAEEDEEHYNAEWENYNTQKVKEHHTTSHL